MQIGKLTNYWPTPTTAGSSNGKSASATSFSEQLAAKTGGASSDAAKSPDPTELTHDFTNLTPAQLRERVHQLIAQGTLTIESSSPLVLAMSADLPISKIEYDGLPPEGGDQPRNILTALANSIAFARSYGDHGSADFKQRTLDILQGLQGQKRISEQV